METLIALKDGHSIVALGKFQEHISTLTWRDVITNHMVKDESLGEKYNEDGVQKLATEFRFNLEDKVDIIKVDTWIILDPHIYYPMRMSTVSIKIPEILKECKDRFKQEQVDIDQYKKLQAHFDIQKAQNIFKTAQGDERIYASEHALLIIENTLKSDPNNAEASELKDEIISNLILIKENKKKNTINTIYGISWVCAFIGLFILNADRLGTYVLTVDRMIFMGIILILIFIPFITSLNVGILGITFKDEKKDEGIK